VTWQACPGAEPYLGSIGAELEGKAARAVARLYWRKLKLKAKLESRILYLSFKRLVPGAFNVGLTG